MPLAQYTSIERYTSVKTHDSSSIIKEHMMMIVDNEADLLKSVFLIKERSEPCEPFLTM